MAERVDQRRPEQLRRVSFQSGFQQHPAGSVLVAFGNTRVICSVSVVDGVPRWMASGDGRGWLTAEYQMLPGATAERSQREVGRGQVSGRSSEIQRLIGRSLRATLDLARIPGRTLYVDCDVLDADGGTRCAAVTGACVALEVALLKLLETGALRDWPMVRRVAAVSVGMVNGEALLDLCYTEDSAAGVDMNVVMTSNGQFVEVQGTAEQDPFSREQMNGMLALAEGGLQELFRLQGEAVRSAPR
jgi:ribonuclease PH